MIGLNDLKRALIKLGEPQHPRAERLTPFGLAARYGLDSASTPAVIKDISTSGIYLVTEKRLPAGELITLALEEEGQPEFSSELQISVQARVVEQREDGMGLSFVLPPGLHADLWGVLIRDIASLTDRDQITLLFRTLRTILILCRLCQSEAEEAILLVGGELDSDHTETLIKIALAAENLLASEPDAGRMRAHPRLLANILREGSWAPDELTMQLWTGLLVSSCSTDAPDDSNQVFVDLLIHITPVQAKIIIYACEQALGSSPGAEHSPSDSIVLNSREIIELTGMYDLYRNATDLAYLYNLGLIKKLFDFTSYHGAETFDITPTILGLELYKHCHGHREKPEQNLIEAANAHLLNFLTQTQPTDIDGKTLPSEPPPSGS